MCFDFLLGGCPGGAHHPGPWGPLPIRGLHYDHLLLRIAMMAQVIGTLLNSFHTFRSDRWEFVYRVEVISSCAVAHSLPGLVYTRVFFTALASVVGLMPSSCWALLVTVQRPYGFWACLRKGDWG